MIPLIVSSVEQCEGFTPERIEAFEFAGLHHVQCQILQGSSLTMQVPQLAVYAQAPLAQIARAPYSGLHKS